MNRRDLVLALLGCSGGSPYTPVQLQKAVFLVSRNAPGVIDEGPKFNFVPYDYGPFDSDVYSEAQSLAASGDAIIAPAASGRWSTYAVSGAGLAHAQQVMNSLDSGTKAYLQQVSNWVRSMNFSSLVKSIYDAYPDMRVNSIFRG